MRKVHIKVFESYSDRAVWESRNKPHISILGWGKCLKTGKYSITYYWKQKYKNGVPQKSQNMLKVQGEGEMKEKVSVDFCNWVNHWGDLFQKEHSQTTDWIKGYKEAIRDVLDKIVFKVRE